MQKTYLRVYIADTEEHADCKVAPERLGLIALRQVQQACRLPLQANAHCQALILESVPHAQQMRVLLRHHSARFMHCSTRMCLAAVSPGTAGLLT